ncbi:MAG: hypothetical protein WC819_02160 [Parcubacteria group bacterium]|jgi:hypothetical protein
MKKNIVVMTMLFGAVIMLSACSAKLPAQEQIQETVNTAQQKVAEVKEGSEKVTGSIKDIMLMGGAVKCTWEDGESGMSGITYVDGEKMNSKTMNMPVGVNGEIGEAYAISDGTWLYMWTSTSLQGTKMKMEKEDLAKAAGNIQKENTGDIKGDGAMDMNAKYNYDCEKWNADATLFVPPTNVTFTDLSAMMEQMSAPVKEGAGAGGGVDMKQICNMLSGQDKIDCEAQFK